MSDRQRWPSWVYGTGTEPDVRFSLANERTFLAWARTALALIAAGVAVDAFDLSMDESLQQVLAATLVGTGLVAAVASWVRWARAERAMRRGEPMPSPSAAVVLAAGIFLVGVVVLVTL